MSLDVKLIKESFEKAKPIADQVADKFYEILFTESPEAKPLFKNVNMDAQKKQLVGGLVKIVDNLENQDILVKYLKELGKRHIKYDTKPEHYPLVGNALIKTLAHFLGDEWTDELQQNWTEAYALITEVMLEGAKEVAPTPENLKKKVHNISLKLIDEELETIFDDDVRAKIREKVRAVLFETLDSEFEELGKK